MPHPKDQRKDCKVKKTAKGTKLDILYNQFEALLLILPSQRAMPK